MATPMRSSAAERTRPARGDLLIVLVIVALAALLAWRVLPGRTGGNPVAVIRLEEETVTSILLPPQGSGSTFLTLDQCPYPLTVEYSGTGIRVSESTCPSGDCTHTGWISTPGQQIICLPNHLIISVEGSGSLPFDAVTG